MFINSTRATPGEDSVMKHSNWMGKSSKGTSLDLSFFYENNVKRSSREEQINKTLTNFNIFCNANRDHFKEEKVNSKNLIEKTELFVVLILYYLYSNDIDIPKIRFSAYNDGIDIKITGDYYKFLITVYENVYAVAYRDVLKNSQNKQNNDLKSIINTIRGIYEDDITKLNINRSISEYLYPDIQTGWFL